MAHEVTKRETIYADLIMNASNLLLTAYVQNEVSLNAETQRLVGLINRMRLFASSSVVEGAESVIKSIIEIALKPGLEVRQLAKEALSKLPGPDPLLKFSELCRADLDNVSRTLW